MSVSVLFALNLMYSVAVTVYDIEFRHDIVVLRYLAIFFFAILRYLANFFAVLQCSEPPNVPLVNGSRSICAVLMYQRVEG